MKNQIKIVILGLLVSIFIFIFYFGLGSNTKNNPQVMVFKKLPAIELRSLYDNNIKISLPRLNQEKFYIINIWASWCTPCRDEHPLLMKLGIEKKIKIFGINYKDNQASARSFLKDLGNPFYYVGIDPDGTNSIELGAYGVPETYIIDSKGIIVLKHVGPLNNDIYKKILTKIE